MAYTALGAMAWARGRNSLMMLTAGAGALAVAGYRTSHADENPSGALSPKEFRSFTITEKTKLTHDTWQYRFGLPADQTAGMDVASCLVTRALLPNGPGMPLKAVIRPYTPTSSKEAKGHMDLVVKVYPNGGMSKHIGALKVGDTLEMKGPFPNLSVTANKWKHVALIAGGSGITPMIQVIDELLGNAEDHTHISVMYSNKTEEDIIMKSRLEKLALRFPGRFKVYFLASDGKFTGGPKTGVVRGAGRITQESIASFIPGFHENVMVMVCGPTGFMETVSGPKAKNDKQGDVGGALAALGYSKDQVFKF
eukprot:CAMPEP_0119102026 /NCGR_PEP_ID=MMETSP1180-20130426/904_1 /TAXON_ID=3052 ORGANISM="Chlamydomonas cf sp, Strain CCMP681" /NCGR_SAMPLE_ID=MMETSP1180 /ASSEMBLY_ACC=CAM_ASM_000741 /LENGTH=308 /DNA_ID=CAMNT_0007086239 /DNA_START=25 /DNA_END=951 /DNA_ORIENTATION=+